MGVYEYRGEPGMGYLYLATAAGTAPHTDLTAGDLIDFGEHEPPQDGRWIEREGATATRVPDNASPEPEPVPLDAQPVEDAPVPRTPPDTFTTPADPAAKRSKPAAKTTA